MKTVKAKDILEFVMAQPDDRPVNMSNNVSGGDCGCVMVDYGKEVLGLEGGWGCGFSVWENQSVEGVIAQIKDGVSIFDLLNLQNSRNPKTYGEIKEKINEKRNN